ncbi:MAG TPA: DUF4126 family protein [Blastocatellia bacterium]|nr:DUF4126 family protein [Blastocatellia bacterium]
MTLLFAFLIGFFGGLRSLTAPAVTSWAAHLGWLRLSHPLSIIGSTPAVVVLTVLAAAELVGDKWSKAPNRTAALGLGARIVGGAVTGACVAVAGSQGIIVGAVLGALGGVAGCFGGYQARRRLVQALGTRDLYVAVVEDLVAIGGSLLVVSRF